MKCKKHPRYKAIHKPRCDCKECWNMYNAKSAYAPAKIGMNTTSVPLNTLEKRSVKSPHET